MGWGFRHFLFEADGTMRPLSQRVADGLSAGSDYLPQYAGFTLRHAFVILEVENKKPVRIFKIDASKWSFDFTGSMRDFMFKAMFAAQATSLRPTWPDTVETPTDEALAARAEFEEKYRWEPGPLEINKIVHAIWPKDAGKQVSRLPAVPGVTKRRVPMTREAKSAIYEIRSGTWELTRTIHELSDASLKAFRQQALDEQMKNASEADGQLVSGIWSGVVAAADAETVSRSRWKNVKGTWYAVLHIWREIGKSESHEIDHQFRKCEGKKAAIDAARDLLIAGAELYDDKTEINVEVYPEGEWFPDAA